MKTKKHFFSKADLAELKVNQESNGKLSNLMKSEDKLNGILGGYNDTYNNYAESTFVNNIYINGVKW